MNCDNAKGSEKTQEFPSVRIKKFFRAVEQIFLTAFEVVPLR